MRFSSALLLAASACGVLARSPQHVGKRIASYSDPAERLQERAAFQIRGTTAADNYKPDPPKHLTPKTKKFYVDGTKIPDVDFDIGESYAGLMPISANKDETRKLYFWYFPSKNTLADDEITIWLNGGPGCSSLEGFLQENGPFLWQYGTFKPFPNPWSWTNLTNMVWVEQPVGTGFSQGVPTAKSEQDVADQFLGFFKQFVDTFALQGKKVFIAGESYAGMYVPHIASAMIDKKDKTYYNLEGTMIYDPSINTDTIMNYIPAPAFLEYWEPLFALNKTAMDYIRAQDAKCGLTKYMEDNLQYPPKGPFPAPPKIKPGGECDMFDYIINAVLLVNPCWDIYQVATTCPVLWDVLGFPGFFTYLPPGAKIYFDRPEVKRAINAPVNTHWYECSPDNVFNTSSGLSTDAQNGVYTSTSVLPKVIEGSKRTVIGHGNLDMVLLGNGTLLSIQNMTWHGKQGFQKPITDDFYVPYHTSYQDLTLAAAGVMGKTHTERGLTFVEINLSGHMVPQYQPSAAYRHLEYLLGRIPSLSSTVPFTKSDQGLIGEPDAPQ